MISCSRRTVCQALFLPATWVAGLAQAADKKLHVAILLSGFETHYGEVTESFLTGLRELGYVEGKNLTVERRYAKLRGDQMPSIARELAELRPDVIVTGCTGSTRAAMQATQTIPIVMASVADPVGQGFVRHLARPGTNVTGRSSQSRQLMPKMMELLHTVAPGAAQVAVLINLFNTAHEALWSDVQSAAAMRGVTPVRAEVRGPSDLASALARLERASAGSLIVLPDDPMTTNSRRQVIDAANGLKLPAIYGLREFAAEGGLMSYGESFSESYRRVGTYVDKLARGARATDLPIEQPTHFQLVVNLKTAGLLGVNPPRTLLLRADELIR